MLNPFEVTSKGFSIHLEVPNTLVSSLIWEFSVVGDLLCGTESIRVQQEHLLDPRAIMALVRSHMRSGADNRLLMRSDISFRCRTWKTIPPGVSNERKI